MTDESIQVPKPHHYWLAAREDMPWLRDPDVEDGAPRWDDTRLRDWSAIGRDVAWIGTQLSWGFYANETGDGEVEDTISYSAEANDPVDAQIVRSWFRYAAEAPAADPGDDGLTNGRHRLWAVWETNPHLRLPIQSVVLEGAEDMPLMDARYAQVVAGEVERVLGAMTPGVRDGNERYVAALERAHSEAVKRANGS